jgi:hypothetical protein
MKVFKELFYNRTAGLFNCTVLLAVADICCEFAFVREKYHQATYFQHAHNIFRPGCSTIFTAQNQDMSTAKGI